MAIAMTFIGQVLLQESPDALHVAIIFPYGVWALGTMVMGLVAVLLYNGRYLRLDLDRGHTDMDSSSHRLNP